MSNHTANTVRTALVLAIAVFVIAFALLLFVGAFGFFASFFLALLVALLAGIVLFIGFGTSGAAAPSVQRTATSGSGAAASAPGGGETATDGQVDGDDASRQAAAEAEAAENEAAEKKAADERRAAEAAEAERRDAEKAAAAERRRAEEEAERKRAEEAAAAAAAANPVAADAVPSGEDYDGDGVVEGTDEGTRPAGLDAPRDGKADDLKQIKGIGAKMEALCNRLGFWHFDQIASWTADEVAWVDANLEGFKGRVTRDDWVGQAKILAEGGATEFSKRVEDGDVY